MSQPKSKSLRETAAFFRARVAALAEMAMENDAILPLLDRAEKQADTAARAVKALERD